MIVVVIVHPVLLVVIVCFVLFLVIVIVIVTRCNCMIVLFQIDVNKLSCWLERCLNYERGFMLEILKECMHMPPIRLTCLVRWLCKL
jgi:hypothetical protein